MSLQYSPYPGSVLRCDFTGFKSPEMTKIRPVVVLSPRLEHIKRTTLLVVPLSTTEPVPAQNYHIEVELPGIILPDGLSKECWVKGDMVYSVGLNRLDLYKFKRNKSSGKREYYKDRFKPDDLHEIRKAVMFAVGLK